MPTPGSIGRHPIHPMLVDLPIGLRVFSVVADLVFWSGFGGAAWRSRGRRPSVLWHLALTLQATAVSAGSFALRLDTPLGTLPVVVSIGGLFVLEVAGWLGGELVFVHGMGVAAAE